MQFLLLLRLVLNQQTKQDDKRSTAVCPNRIVDLFAFVWIPLPCKLHRTEQHGACCPHLCRPAQPRSCSFRWETHPSCTCCSAWCGQWGSGGSGCGTVSHLLDAAGPASGRLVQSDSKYDDALATTVLWQKVKAYMYKASCPALYKRALETDALPIALAHQN